MYCIVSASRNLRDSQGLSCPRNPPPLSSGNSGRILHGSVPYQSVPRSKLPRRSESAAGTTRAWRQDIISLPCLSWSPCEPRCSVRGKRCLRVYNSAELTGRSQPRRSRFFSQGRGFFPSSEPVGLQQTHLSGNPGFRNAFLDAAGAGGDCAHPLSRTDSRNGSSEGDPSAPLLSSLPSSGPA